MGTAQWGRDARAHAPRIACTERSRTLPSASSGGAAASRGDRTHPLRELHIPGSPSRPRFGIHEQVRRGIPGPPLLRRPREHRRDRASGQVQSEAVVPLRARQRATALGRPDEHGGVPSPPRARRHGDGHGSQPWRPPDPRRSGLAHGQALQVDPLQDRSRRRRADRLRRTARKRLGAPAQNDRMRVLVVSPRLRLRTVQEHR